MAHTTMVTTARVGLLAAVFALGFLAGSVSQRSAEAQLGDALKAAGGSAVEDAAGSGGALGTAAKLGTSITEMQESVDTLQRNLEILNSIKGVLGG